HALHIVVGQAAAKTNAGEEICIMSSPTRMKFPGEDFFHPGFTPAGFTPTTASEDEVLTSRLEPQAIPIITRKPVPSASQQTLSTSSKPNPLAMNPVLTSSPEAAMEESAVTGSGEKRGLGLGLAQVSNAETTLVVPVQNLLSSESPTEEVSTLDSAYGDSSAVSANPSQPSPPAPWPAMPHVQKDYAFSQLHGSDAPSQEASQPVSPISDSDYFDSTQASRANSLAHRVSHRTVAPTSATSDAPMPPLPIKHQKLPDEGEQREKVHGEHSNGRETTTPVQENRRSTNNWPLGLYFDGPSDDINPKAAVDELPAVEQSQSHTALNVKSPSILEAPPPSQLRAPNTQQQMFGSQKASQQYQPTFSPHRSSQTFIPYRASHPQYATQAPFDTRFSLPPVSMQLERPPMNSQQSRYSSATMGGTTPFLHHNDEEGFFDSRTKEPNRKDTATFSTAGSSHSIFTSFRASWLPEILWVLLSITCLGIIAVILSRFDQEPLREFSLPITLNTLVAFFITICHAALIFPVAQGLSQLKWNWFATKDRSLADFQAFEDAITGPVGAVKLLIATKGRVLNLVLVVILLLGLVTSAMTQMIIAYPTRLANRSAVPQVFRAEAYPSNNNQATSVPELDRRQKQSIQNGIYNPVDEPIINLAPVCRSKECEVQKFSSLAVCSRTEDISNRLQISADSLADELSTRLGLDSSRQVRNASLSNGAYLTGSTDTYNVNITSPLLVYDDTKPANISFAFSDQPNLMAAAISNIFIIYTKQASFQEPGSPSPVSDTAFGAMEILFHFCVADYTVRSGIGMDQGITPFKTRVGERTIVLSEAGEDYRVDRNSAAALMRYMTSTFYGTFSAAMGSGAVGHTSTSDALGLSMFGASSQTLPESDRLAAVRNLTQNVATSLTNTIRTQGIQISAASIEQETYISIRWGWFAFLVVQVVLAAGFLGGVIMETILLDVRVLKSSALAGMFAVSAEDRKLLEVEGIGRVHEGHVMATAIKADGIRGRFVCSGEREGWVLDLGVR
ncbi:hypothetical protein PpBr36_00847, partial [Pyricularia pennisetigena]|uniref:hypothetical protein n=1 Tax=Pyricularia pennisetigena TaxID=1578925 RepID=UPI001153D26E